MGLWLSAPAGLAVLFWLGLAGVLHMTSHLLKVLLYLEAAGLLLMSSVFYFGSSYTSYLFFTFILMTFLVAEAALGLGVLVAHSRQVGGDHLVILLFKLKNY